MRIKHINTICLSRPHELEQQWITARYRCIKADCAVVVIDTDEGLRGIGEASAYGHPLRIRDWVRWLSPALIGRDPLDPEVSIPPNGGDRSFDAAVSGIDCALWDLRGKITGKRVAELLWEEESGDGRSAESGGPADRVRLYASAGCSYDWRGDPTVLIREAESYIERGYTAMKFRLGTHWEWDGVTVERFLGLVRELHQQVDGRMDLILDGNCRLSEDQAIAIAKELDSLGFLWFEEPVPWSSPDSYARIARSVSIPISGGESFTTLPRFRPFLDSGGYRIVQPDAGMSGIRMTSRIVRLARRFGARFCPHSWHNGLMMMANAHLVAADREPQLLEHCMIQGPLQFGILDVPPTIENGWLVLPDAPGLGVELSGGDADPRSHPLEERFPYIEGGYALEVSR